MFGSLTSSGYESERLREDAQRRWDDLDGLAPSFDDLAQQTGYVVESIYDGPQNSQFQDLQTSTAGGLGEEAQRRALAQMQGVIDAGGYTSAERGQLQQVQHDAALGERRQAAAVEQQMAARGLTGSGVDMAARMSAQQNAANRSRQAATDISTAAQQRALQAMQMQSGIGGQMRSSEGMDRGRSMDRAGAIERFNAANTDYRRGLNTRTAQGRGLTNRQNADARSRAAQQQFGNRVTATSGQTGQLNTNASVMEQQRAAEQAAMTQMMSSTAGMAGGVAGG